jgi:ATP-binding cassette subfamily F protein uup
LWREYEGGYEDWKLQRDRARSLRDKAARAAPAPTPPAAAAAAPAAAPVKKAKLSYKEQRELDGLPARIEALETEQKQLADLLSGVEIYTDAKRLADVQARCAALDDELLAAMERWEALGSR